MTTPSRALSFAIYASAVLVGGVLMGFEMLGSRYLFPYFGGSIGTWASLISTVLCALAIGYFAGSAIVAQNPSQRTIGLFILIAAAYLACVPASADGVMEKILDGLGDGPSATLTASTALLLVPLSLLGTFSPIAVSILTRSAEDAGRVAGLVYGVSTLGNVVGTLFTTFTLIPTVGSRAITYIFAVVLAGCAGLLFLPLGAKDLPMAVTVWRMCLLRRWKRLALAATVAPSLAWAERVNTELFDGQRAMALIAEQLRFTPRSLDTPGHQQTIDFIKAELAKAGVDNVSLQRWAYRAENGKPYAMTNIVARLDASNPRRMILATHYDSIIRAYADKTNPNGPMPGANNSASGVAVLLESARVLSLLPKPAVGIDMIFFDGEEGPKSLGAGDPQWHALGSPYFTAHLKDFYPNAKPEKAVVFDMVCDRDLKLKPEPFSLTSALPEVQKFWQAGAEIAPSAFDTHVTAYPISDDHTALAAAGIPSFLVIDFDYEPYFNTTQDTPDKCSAASLQAVGRTALQYLYVP